MACSTVSNFSVFQEDSGKGVLVTVTSLSERKINDNQPRRGWKNMILVAKNLSSDKAVCPSQRHGVSLSLLCTIVPGALGGHFSQTLQKLPIILLVIHLA
jgi:hypothetical protein